MRRLRPDQMTVCMLLDSIGTVLDSAAWRNKAMNKSGDDDRHSQGALANNAHPQTSAPCAVCHAYHCNGRASTFMGGGL